MKIRPEMASHPLAVAAREVNDRADERGLVATVRSYGLEAADLRYMAEQRALRALFASYGRNLQLKHSTTFQLSESEERLMKTLTSCYMDGLLIGFRAREILYEQNKQQTTKS
jgi:hypothetical protein